MVKTVPHTGATQWLLLQDLSSKANVESPKVGHFAGGVDLGLVRRLALAQHCRGIERRSPRSRQEVGGFEEDGGALVK